MEPHPLWEYPSYPRSDVHNLMSFDFAARIPSKSLLLDSGEIELTGQQGPCHAVVLWMDYELTDTIRTTTGLKQVSASWCVVLGLREICYKLLCPKFYLIWLYHK